MSNEKDEALSVSVTTPPGDSVVAVYVDPDGKVHTWNPETEPSPTIKLLSVFASCKTA